MSFLTIAGLIAAIIFIGTALIQGFHNGFFTIRSGAQLSRKRNPALFWTSAAAGLIVIAVSVWMIVKELR